jgi:hypothetical protein
MADVPQSYPTHRRYFPLFHFIVLPLLAINLIIRIIYAYRHWGSRLPLWEILVAFALISLALTVRVMVLTVQDRLIRLEETLRLQRCLPDDLRGRVGDLTSDQLVALRFCGDDSELAVLTRSVLGGQLTSRDDIKKNIKAWRPDTLRA